MKTVRYLLLVTGFLMLSAECIAQKESVLVETESVALDKGYFALSIKTQFPIQHALGIEYRGHSGFGFSMGLGQLSRAYTVAAIGFLPEEDENQELRKQFIEDKMKNGLVFEAGAFYYPRRFNDFYIGFNIQFQRFTLPATPQELVENYGFAEQIDQDQLSEALNSDVAQFFYENTIIEPIIKPVQLGVSLGKSFSFKKIPRLYLLAELNYQFNLASSARFNSPSVIGSIIVNSFIEPNLQPSTEESFSDFNLPSLSIKLQYRLDISPGASQKGKKIKAKIQ